MTVVGPALPPEGTASTVEEIAAERSEDRGSGRLGRLRRLVARLLQPGRPAAAVSLAAPRGFRVERDDLLARCTREDIEAREQAVDPLGGAPAVPFGHLNPAWQRFVRTLGTEDELWRFHAQRIALDGAAEIRSGYVVVRNGRPGQAMMASVRSLPAVPATDRSSPRRGGEAAPTESRQPAAVE